MIRISAKKMTESFAQQPALTPVEELLELSRPETSVIDWILACAVALFAIAWVWPFFRYCSFGSDEGIVLQGAARILRGEIPYRDFFSFYTPGSYYLYAALFKLFGTSLLVARAALLFYAALFSFLTYLLARRACSRLASLLAASLVALLCLPARFVVIHNWDSTASALLALYCAVWLLQTNAAWWSFLCGICAGTTVMIEQSKGAGLILGLAIAGLLLHRLDPRRRIANSLLAGVLGAAIPLLAVFAYFAAHHALIVMLQGWMWPLFHYTAVNQLPYGYIQWSSALRDIAVSSGWLERLILVISFSPLIIAALLPLLMLGLSATLGVKLILGQLESNPLRFFVIVTGSVLLGEFLATWITGRHDALRMVFLAPLFFCMLPLFLDRRLVKVPTLSNLGPLLALFLLVSFVAFGLVRIPLGAKQVIASRRGILKTDMPEGVLPYLQDHVAAGTKLFAYPYLPLYSFLSGTFSPTRFEYLQPGMHTPAQFEEARKELERDRTPAVLFDITFPEMAAEVWPSTPANVLANDPTADFILSHYRGCATLMARERPFEYMVRKDLTCPK